IARMPCGHAVGKDKARGWVRRDAGLAAKRYETVALACEDGRHRASVGIDQFTVRECLSLGEPGRLLAGVRMAGQGCGEGRGDTLTLGVPARRRLVQKTLGLLPQYGNGRAKLQEFRVLPASQLDIPEVICWTQAPRPKLKPSQVLSIAWLTARGASLGSSRGHCRIRGCTGGELKA